MSTTGGNNCVQCGGFIGEPGKAYGYSGKYCFCANQNPYAPYIIKQQEYSGPALLEEIQKIKEELKEIKDKLHNK